jgi:hypothetical protein
MAESVRRDQRPNAVSLDLSCAQRPKADSSREPQRAMAVNLAGNPFSHHDLRVARRENSS